MVASVQRVYGRRRPGSDRNATDMGFWTSQTRFPPVRRSARTKGPAWSAPSKRQQTITQMNSFHSLYQSDENEQDLQYLEDAPEFQGESPARAKRQKICEDENDTPTQPLSTRLTRSATTKATAHSISQIERISENLRPLREHQLEDRQASKLMPPPPKTPISKRMEIPSSQSPIATPLSTRRGEISRQYNIRSPLKERSSNALMRQSPSAKAMGDWVPAREIPDSLENEIESSLTTSRGYDSSLKTDMAADDAYQDLAAPQSPKIETHSKDADRRSHTGHDLRLSLSIQKQTSSSGYLLDSKGRKKLEILDSDAEDESGDETPLPYLDKMNSQPPPNTRKAPNTKRISQLPPAPSTPPIVSHRPFQPLSLQPPPKPTTIPSTHPTIDVPSSQPTSPTTPPTIHQPLQLSIPPPPQTQPTLITESQYDQGWKSYHAPNSLTTSHHHLPPSSSALQPLSSPQNPPSSPSSDHDGCPTLTTIPTQPLPPQVPPSQATTVDTTQPSPSPSQILPSSPISQQQQQQQQPPTPPQPPAFSSSSPVLARGVGDGWDGRVWTDSQLLPASLMEDSFLGVGEE